MVGLSWVRFDFVVHFQHLEHSEHDILHIRHYSARTYKHIPITFSFMALILPLGGQTLTSVAVLSNCQAKMIEDTSSYTDFTTVTRVPTITPHALSDFAQDGFSPLVLASGRDCV